MFISLIRVQFVEMLRDLSALLLIPPAIATTVKHVYELEKTSVHTGAYNLGIETI